MVLASACKSTTPELLSLTLLQNLYILVNVVCIGNGWGTDYREMDSIIRAKSQWTFGFMGSSVQSKNFSGILLQAKGNDSCVRTAVRQGNDSYPCKNNGVLHVLK
jgi:hypothetical protein